MKLTLSRVAEFVHASGSFDPAALATGFSIDSRTLIPGDLFFAVRGENHDGHDFVIPALKKGAIGAVVRRDRLDLAGASQGILAVDDPLLALQALGSAVRRLWGKQLVAVTGSAGKTTTKDAIAHLLTRRFRVLKSQGNLNNHFGLPLQLLKLDAEHEMAVVEMGMNHPGEIAALAKIAAPDTGVVTCVAPVHLEFFESVADIARAKYELIEALPHGSTAVLNADDPFVAQFGRDFHGRVITFGMVKPADVRAESIEGAADGSSGFSLHAGGKNVPVRLPLVGRHNISNALAAVAVATRYGVSLEECADALSELRSGDKRGERIQIAGATILNDSYNSNPKALESMVQALAAMPARRRIVVAGEMLELGNAGPQLHAECGRFLKGRADLLIGVRGLAADMVAAAQSEGVTSIFASTPEEAGEILARELREGDAVLLKASRGVRLEKALEKLQDLLVPKDN